MTKAQRIRELNAKGMSDAEIAAVIGSKKDYVRRIIKRGKVRFNRRWHSK